MKMMKKKLKRILKNEWVKKVIIILLAILVASITTSFCFGIKKAEGGEGHDHDHEATPSPAAKTDSDDDTEDEDDEFDFGEDDEDDADDADEAEETDEADGKKVRERFQCDIDERIKEKNTDDIVKILVALHKDEHKKRYEQGEEIDDLKDEVKSYREQNMILLATIDKMDRRFATLFSTQFGLLDPAMTPERMEASIGELRAKKEELVSGISQRNSLLSAIAQEIKRLERKKKLTADEQVQLSLNRIQKKQVEGEILEMSGSLEEILTRAKLIEARRSQVTGNQPTRPFGPETAPQAQTPESAANQPAPQSLNTEDQIRPLLVALLRRGNRNGRQPAIQPNTFPPNRNVVQGQRPPLSGRGQRGIVAN